MSSLADRLKLAMKETGCTSSKLSRDAGYHPLYVSKVLRGDIKKPGRRFVSYLQARYNINPDWLLFDKGDMFLSERKNDFRAGYLANVIESLPRQERAAAELIIEALMFMAESRRET